MTPSPRVSLLVDTDLLEAAHVNVVEGRLLGVASLHIGGITILNHAELDPYRLAEALVSWGQAMQDRLVDLEGERAEQEAECDTCGGSQRCIYPSIEAQTLVEVPCPDCSDACNAGGAPWDSEAAYLESRGDRESGR